MLVTLLGFFLLAALAAFLVLLHLNDWGLDKWYMWALAGFLTCVISCFCMFLVMRKHNFMVRVVDENNQTHLLPKFTNDCAGGDPHVLVYVTPKEIEILEGEGGTRSPFILKGVPTGIDCYPQLRPAFGPGGFKVGPPRGGGSPT